MTSPVYACAPQKPLPLAKCINARANSGNVSAFVQKICSVRRACAKLNFNVSISNGLGA